MRIEIKARWTGLVLFSIETDTLKLAVEAAVRQGAYLKGANLEGANLEGANLEGADLEGADLEGPKEDFWKVLDAAPHEVAGLRQAMIDGKIDGSTYSGECACLVGTIANVRKCGVDSLAGLVKDSSRPAEKWFLMFSPGHTPKNHGGMKVTLKWLDEWTAKMAVYK